MGLCNFGPQAYVAISVFWEVSFKTLFTRYHFALRLCRWSVKRTRVWVSEFRNSFIHKILRILASSLLCRNAMGFTVACWWSTFWLGFGNSVGLCNGFLRASLPSLSHWGDAGLGVEPSISCFDDVGIVGDLDGWRACRRIWVMIPNMLQWLPSFLVPGNRYVEDRIQNVMKGTVNLHAHGEPLHTGDNSESVVHLSEVNSSTRETGTRVYTKNKLQMQDRNWSRFLHFIHMKETLYHPTLFSKMVTRLVRTKMNEMMIKQYFRAQFLQQVKQQLDEDAHTKIGLITFIGAATRRDSSTF